MISIYVNDIRCSLKNKCYFSALSLALALPDMCGMAEFPNKSVSERYIEWCDKYLGAYMAQGKDDLDVNNPWLSGEVIYNLRNTYLHQGTPGIESDKVKEEANQLDKFILMLGDGTVLQSRTLNIEAGTQKTGKITYKELIVDVTYLCDSICYCASWYYKNNQEKFKFDLNVITQEEFLNPSSEMHQFSKVDIYKKILNQKLENEGSPKRFHEDFEVVHSSETCKSTDIIPIDEMLKQHSPGDVTASTNSSKKASKEKREAQVRSFFNKHFKKKVYVNKKEEIIQAVLKSKTKMEINNKLMKLFSNGKEVSKIYKELGPLIKDLPGK